jgi:hypothetical protein
MCSRTGELVSDGWSLEEWLNPVHVELLAASHYEKQGVKFSLPWTWYWAFPAVQILTGRWSIERTQNHSQSESVDPDISSLICWTCSLSPVKAGSKRSDIREDLHWTFWFSTNVVQMRMFENLILSDGSERFCAMMMWLDLIGLKRWKFPLWTSFNGKYQTMWPFNPNRDRAKSISWITRHRSFRNPEWKNFTWVMKNPTKNMHFYVVVEKLLLNSGSLFWLWYSYLTSYGISSVGELNLTS